MNQFVTDHEYRLCFHGQDDRQEHVFPDCEPTRDKDLPHSKNERRRPQKRPGPDRQIVPEQAALRCARRVHAASVGTQRPIKRAGDTHEHKRRQQPPAAMNCTDKNQRENAQWKIMRKGAANRRFDVLRDHRLVRARVTTCACILRHGSFPDGLFSACIGVHVIIGQSDPQILHVFRISTRRTSASIQNAEVTDSEPCPIRPAAPHFND